MAEPAVVPGKAAGLMGKAGPGHVTCSPRDVSPALYSLGAPWLPPPHPSRWSAPATLVSWGALSASLVGVLGSCERVKDKGPGALDQLQQGDPRVLSHPTEALVTTSQPAFFPQQIAPFLRWSKQAEEAG